MLPSVIYNMDEDSKELYRRVLQQGKETKREIRVLILGQKGAGKTTLTRRLLSMSIEDVTDTNGIEIHSVLLKDDEDDKNNDWNEKCHTPGKYDLQYTYIYGFCIIFVALVMCFFVRTIFCRLILNIICAMF